MKLPNGEYAVVSLAKLRDYALNPDQDTGKHKARVFSSALGVTAADTEWLRDVLLKKAVDEDAVLRTSTTFGDRYFVDFELHRHGKTAVVRSSWIILRGELVPRLVSCFVRRLGIKR